MKKRDAYVSGQVRDHENVEPDGFYPTWPPATRSILRAEPLQGLVWEPMCGEGDMAEVLQEDEFGYDVYATDLIDRGYGWGGVDFFRTWNLKVPNVVTNPDFKISQRAVNHALRCTTDRVIMFLRLAFLEGQDRGAWFPGTPLEAVYVNSRRVPIQRGRIAVEDDVAGPMATAWFVWRHGYEGEPALRFIDWESGL